MRILLSIFLLLGITCHAADDLTTESKQDLNYLHEKVCMGNWLTFVAGIAPLHELIGLSVDIGSVYTLYSMDWEAIGEGVALELPAAVYALLKKEIDSLRVKHATHNSKDVKFWASFSDSFTKQISFKCPLGVYKGIAKNGELADGIVLSLFIRRATNGDRYEAQLTLTCSGRSSFSTLDVKIDDSNSEKFGTALYCIQRNNSKLKAEYEGVFEDSYLIIADFTLSLRGRNIWICKELKK